MKYNVSPLEQNYWYFSDKISPRLSGAINCEILIVGGGMAGLHAAHAFLQRGLSVVLIEKNFCGAGATGKSSGFITPDSEFSLHELLEHDPTGGKKLWEFVESGVAGIRGTIQDFDLDCDFALQDTCVVANSAGSYNSDILKEHEARKSLGYESHLYSAQEVAKVVNSSDYYGAVRYGNTFGINGYAYCQAFKRALMAQGLRVYEDTPAISVGDHTVQTPYGCVKADHIVLCVDRFLPDIVPAGIADEVYQVQTFLMMSEPLTDQQVKLIFPEAPVMVWDTDLIYTYYRLAGDNRLMVGGGSLLTLYTSREDHFNKRIKRQLINYVGKKFPTVNPVFSYFWSGLIGVSKDVVPLAGAFEDRPWLYYVGAGAGLPWASALGRYSAEHKLYGRTEFDDLLSPYRKFPVGNGLQRCLGKGLSFAISQGITIFLK